MDKKNPFTTFLKLDEIFPHEKKSGIPGLRSSRDIEASNSTPTTLQSIPSTPTPVFTPSPASPLSMSGLHALSKILEIKNKIAGDISENCKFMNEFNRSRRKQLLIHLEKLSGEFHKSHLEAPDEKVRDLIKKWIDSHPQQNSYGNNTLSEAQKDAFKTYLNEATLYTLGLILLCKSWNDRGYMTFNEPDLETLQPKLIQALKPSVSLNRENWKIVCRNLYSWYKPKKSVCTEVWNILQSFNLSQENDDYIPSLFEQLLTESHSQYTLRFYDIRFHRSFWKFYQNLEPHPRKKMNAFTPTFRCGAFSYSGPAHFDWYGFEANPFLAMTSEFYYLFSMPKPPNFLETGYGFEAHSKDQLSFSMGHTPSTLTSITEMGACDFASVFEEHKISPNEKTALSWELKETLESLPFYKNLKNQNSHIGILQSCLSLSKIRPGGLFFWFRESPLHYSDGMQSIEFLFNKSTLLCEWDFSEVSHQLPAHSKLFPQYVYLFKKELDSQKRNTHRPKKIKIAGPLRSHIELPTLLDEAFDCFFHEKKERLGQWSIHSFISTSPQEDWLTQWPETSSQKDIELIHEMKTNTIPLGQIALIRNANTTNKEAAPPSLLQLNESNSSYTLWITTQLSEQNSSEERSLYVSSEPPLQTNKTTFSISFSHQKYVAPLQSYLMSQKVQKWLDLNIERKRNKWLLTEQHLKYIPVPQSLLNYLHSNNHSFNASIEKLNQELFKEKSNFDGNAREQLLRSIQGLKPETVFIIISEKSFEISQQASKLSQFINPQGEIQWIKIVDILPPSEKCAFTQHPEIQIEGKLPSHIPIIEIQSQKNAHGFTFITEGGLFCLARFKNPSLKEIFSKLIQSYKNPTWNELCTQVVLPRHSHIAEVTAEEFLQIFHKYQNELKKLKKMADLFIPS